MTRTRLLEAVALMTSLVLAACGGGGSGGPITVSGTVVDDTGAPVSSANVVINGDSAGLVTTAADGAFSFPKITPPYTLTIKSGTTIVEYQGLRRAKPQVVFGTGGLVHTAALAGSVTGTTFPLASGDGIALGATNGVLAAGFTDNMGAYSTTFGWAGASSITTDLVALHATASGSLITGYDKIGKRTGVTLQDGVGQTGLDIALTTPVTTATTTFDYDVGAYTGSPHVGYVMLNAGGAQFFLGMASMTIPSGTSVLLPDGGGTFVVGGQDADGNTALRIGSAVLGGTTTIDLPATTALANSLPADAATGVSKLPLLSWTPVTGAELYLVKLSTSGLEYDFFLPGSSATLAVPDYSVLGLALAGATSYSWSVTAMKWSGISPDALTDPAVGGLNELGLYQATDLTFYTSSHTSFTTAP
jgi:hypothetical protein